MAGEASDEGADDEASNEGVDEASDEMANEASDEAYWRGDLCLSSIFLRPTRGATVHGRGLGQQQIGSHHKGFQPNGGLCAMHAYSDDRSGPEPGDDEVVAIDLACLDAQRDDANVVVMMGNVYEPARLN